MLPEAASNDTVEILIDRCTEMAGISSRVFPDAKPSRAEINNAAHTMQLGCQAVLPSSGNAVGHGKKALIHERSNKSRFEARRPTEVAPKRVCQIVHDAPEVYPVLNQ